MSTRKLPWIGAIDQGTSSSRFFVFDSSGDLVSFAQTPIKLICSSPGIVEQDPVELVESVKSCIKTVCDDISSKYPGEIKDLVKAIGITNQRETTVVWNNETGKPLNNTIVWMDTRNSKQISELAFNSSNVELFKKTGLPLSTYFSCGKMKWLLNQSKNVRECATSGKLNMGTVDSWLLWNLTGEKNFLTDITNAHRTGLVSFENVDHLNWDNELMNLFDIKSDYLAKIRSSAEHFGNLNFSQLEGVPITGILGDQHAALLGRGCEDKGQIKNTYGTGCFMLCNIGDRIKFDDLAIDERIIKTVAFKLGPRAPTKFALEASLSCGGTTIEWASDKINLLPSPKDLDFACASDSRGVTFIPGLSGFLAPRWNPNAQGAFIGLSLNSGKREMVKSIVDSIAFANKEVFEIIQKVVGKDMIKELIVDGGLTNSQVMMQTQADIIGIPLVRPRIKEATVFGAAKAAAIGAGYNNWPNSDRDQLESPDLFQPKSSSHHSNYIKWIEFMNFANKIGP